MRRTALHLFPAGILGLTLAAASGPAEAPKGLTAENVRELQAKYQAERAEADKQGLTKQFSPEWYQRAAALAKQGEAALAAGRLVEASETFRRARWHLPAMPPHLPPHVARIFGDPRLRHTGPVVAVAFSPDGTRLASASQDGTIKVWDVTNGREVCQYIGHIDKANDRPFNVKTLAFSPDGKTVASAGHDPEIKIWDAATGKDVKSLRGHKEFLSTIAFSPDGKLLAAAGGDREVRLYDVATGALKRDPLVGHNLVINALAFSPDGKSVVSVSSDRAVRGWDATSGAVRFIQQWSRDGRSGNLFCVAFSPTARAWPSAVPSPTPSRCSTRPTAASGRASRAPAERRVPR